MKSTFGSATCARSFASKGSASAKLAIQTAATAIHDEVEPMTAMIDFDEWWTREGKFIDPDTCEALAQCAFRAAIAQSRNYVADDHVEPTQFTFANGRVVTVGDDGTLKIGEVEP